MYSPVFPTRSSSTHVSKSYYRYNLSPFQSVTSTSKKSVFFFVFFFVVVVVFFLKEATQFYTFYLLSKEMESSKESNNVYRFRYVPNRTNKTSEISKITNLVKKVPSFACDTRRHKDVHSGPKCRRMISYFTFHRFV